MLSLTCFLKQGGERAEGHQCRLPNRIVFGVARPNRGCARASAPTASCRSRSARLAGCSTSRARHRCVPRTCRHLSPNWRAGANAKKVQGDHARQVVGRGFAPRAEQAGYQLELAPPRERPTAPAGSRCLRPCCASLVPVPSSSSHARQLLPSTAPTRPPGPRYRLSRAHFGLSGGTQRLIFRPALVLYVRHPS